MQGFGNVGSAVANILAQEYGCKLVAVSDVSGGLYNPYGLDLPALTEYVRHNPGLLLSECSADGQADSITNAELLTLDVDVLQRQLLAPILAIGDVRADRRIDFVGGSRGTAELERLVTGGKAAVAFSMYPVSIGDLVAIADAGGSMPPKSTWFEPKLRDGLLTHLI